MSRAFDYVATLGNILASAFDPDTKTLDLTLSGVPSLSLSDEPDDEAAGEVASDVAAFGALGILCRPAPPEDRGGRKYAAQHISFRTEDGMIPLGFRDARLWEAFPAGIPEGSTRIPGYGGGFIALDRNTAGETIISIFVPYANGTKAHQIVIDPTSGNENITLTNGQGYQLSLTGSGLQCRTPITPTAPGSYLSFSSEQFVVRAPKIVLEGIVALGAVPSAALPLLPGPISQPTPSVFFSPV